MLTPFQHNVLLQQSKRAYFGLGGADWANAMVWLVNNGYVRDVSEWNNPLQPTEKGWNYLDKIKAEFE